MKKILALILASLMILSALAFVGCGDKDDGKKEETSKTEVTTVAETDAETEVTTEADEETTLAEETTKSGELFEDEEEIDVFDPAGNQTASAINEKSKGTGVQFTMPENEWLNGARILCPSWGDDIGSLTFYIYKWDTDFATTVAAEPVYKETFVDYADNTTLEILLDDKSVTNGTYILIAKDGIDESGSGVGVWCGPRMDEYDAEDYAEYNILPVTNGKVSEKAKSIAKITLLVGYYD